MTLSHFRSYLYVVLGLSVTFQQDANNYLPTQTSTPDTCKGEQKCFASREYLELKDLMALDTWFLNTF